VRFNSTNHVVPHENPFWKWLLLETPKPTTESGGPILHDTFGLYDRCDKNFAAFLIEEAHRSQQEKGRSRPQSISAQRMRLTPMPI
jgi:hypothetical protein